MKYLIYSLKKFKEKYYKDMILAQKEIYPNEPRVQPEDSEPYEGSSWVIAAIDEDEVAGFSAFAIYKEARNCNYSGSNLYFYVKPEYRRGITAGRLIKDTEEFCFIRGCSSFKWDVNVDSSLVQVFDKRSSYKKESIIYSKSLI